MSSERTRSFPTTMMSPITAMVKVRRDVVEVKVRIGNAVDVKGMTRMAAWGGGDEERRCTLSP